MRKTILALAAAGMAITASAQSAIDAYNIIPGELRGTARFMSMGGAFTALGGDLSVLSQNPAGIGIYRRSEIGATLDIGMRKFTTQTPAQTLSSDLTKVACNNFGYIGTTMIEDSEMRSFSWGVSYNRLAQFDQTYTGYNMPTQTSLTNYIASFTDGINKSQLDFGVGFNPYQDGDADWLSILGYTTFLIVNRPMSDNKYQGLYQPDVTTGDAIYTVRDRGYVDEYNISFGGNVSDLVYWGLGVGIHDMKYERTAYYSESMADAVISCDAFSGYGDAGFAMTNYKTISGSGANLKFGVIVKPINELRIGLAIHTPTWMSLNTTGDAVMQYSYYNPDMPKSEDNPFEDKETTDLQNYSWRLNTPWRLLVGASAVIGSSAIVSADYERVAYNDMTVKYQTWDYLGYGSYVTDDYVKEDIRTYFRAANIFRVGAELRLTRQLSLRAGYNLQTSNVKTEAYNGQQQIITAGTDPSFRFDDKTSNICVGLGYRYQAWYIDAAYVHTARDSRYYAFTNFAGNQAPSAKLSTNYNSIVLSTGFRF